MADVPDPVSMGAIALGAITLGGALVKLLEKLIDKAFGKKEPDVAAHVESADRVEKKIDALLDWHTAKDSNGLPLGYFPRSMVEDQKEIAEFQRETAALMGKILERLESHDERMASGLAEVRRDIARLGK